MKDDEDDCGKQLEGLDYNYWGRMPGWTVKEAAALLLDLDPDRSKKDGKDAGFDAKEWEYFRLRRLMKRAETMDLLSSPMSPREFLQWAMSNNIPRNEKLEGIVTSTKRLSDWRKRYMRMKRQRDRLAEELEDEVLPKERLTLLKLVLGMARVKFGHKKGSKSTVGQIHDGLEKKGRGIMLTKDSIKKYLDEADERIDEIPSSETGA